MLDSTYIDNLPDRFRGLHKKVLEKNCSPRQAIKAKCQECCGFENVIERVRDCESKKCPLWHFRPYQSK